MPTQNSLSEPSGFSFSLSGGGPLPPPCRGKPQEISKGAAKPNRTPATSDQFDPFEGQIVPKIPKTSPTKGTHNSLIQGDPRYLENDLSKVMFYNATIIGSSGGESRGCSGDICLNLARARFASGKVLGFFGSNSITKAVP